MSGTIAAPLGGAASPSPAGRPNWLRPKYVLFALLTLMYIYVMCTSERFLIDAKDPEWQHIESFKWILLPHGLAAACALFLGPLQFSDRLRTKFAKAHRVLGRFYVAGVIVGAPLGIYIEYFEERMGSPRSFTIATVADAGVWLLATTVAMICILQGKVQLHRQWMTRSFACALIFLEGRMIAGLFNQFQNIETIVWFCVAAAFPLADLTLYIEEALRLRALAARTRRPVAA